MSSFGARHWTLFLVLVVVVLIHSLWIVVLLPPNIGPDESSHYDYVTYLAHEKRLPDPRTENVGQAQHPPLPYAILAAAYRLFITIDNKLDDSTFAGRDGSRMAGRKTSFHPGRRGSEEFGIPAETPDERLNEMLHSRRWVFHALRFIPFVLGIATLFTMLAAMRHLVPDQPTLALLLTALGATISQYPFHFATLSNDGFISFLGALLAWYVLRAWRRGVLRERRTLLLTSLICGLGCLVKLLFAGPMMFALIMVLGAAPKGTSLVERWRPAFWLALGPLVIAAWWHVRQFMLQGSLLAVKQHAEHSPFLLRESQWHPFAIVEFLAEATYMFFGQLGHDMLGPPNIYYIPAAGAAAAALFGVLFLKRAQPAPPADAPQAASTPHVAAAVLALATLLVLLNVSNVIYFHGHGRYMMVILVPLLVILASGLERLAGRRLPALLFGLLAWNLLFLVPTYFTIFANRYSIDTRSIDRGNVVRYFECGNSNKDFDVQIPGTSTRDVPFPILYKPEFTVRYANQPTPQPVLVYEVAIPDATRRYQVRVRYPDAISRHTSDDRGATANAMLADSAVIHGPQTLWHSFGVQRFPLPDDATSDGVVRLWWNNQSPQSRFVAVAELWVEEAWMTLAAPPALIQGAGGRRVRFEVTNVDSELPHEASVFILQGDALVATAPGIRLAPRAARVFEVDAPEIDGNRDLVLKLVNHELLPWANVKLLIFAAPDAARGGNHDVPGINVLRVNDGAEATAIATVPLADVPRGRYALDVTHPVAEDALRSGRVVVAADGAVIEGTPEVAAAGYGKRLARTRVVLQKSAVGDVVVRLGTVGGGSGAALEFDRLLLTPLLSVEAPGHTWAIEREGR